VARRARGIVASNRKAVVGPLAGPLRAPAATIVLNDDQIAFFHREGFLSLPKITSAEEVDFVRGIYDRLFDARTGWRDGNYLDYTGVDDMVPARLPQILMPSVYEPALKETAIFANCQAIARQLLGPAAEFIFDHATLKPARTGPPTPWHQDQAFYGAGTAYFAITFWIPLQPVTRDSGCLRFVPRSNTGPLLEHRPLNGDRRVHGLEALEVDDAKAVYCPLDAGGATIHHYMTVHGADANCSGTPRRAYALGFGVRLAKPLVRREYAWNRGKNAPHEIRFRSSLSPWRRLKRTLRLQLVRLGLY
jgi:hypothetical protein